MGQPRVFKATLIEQDGQPVTPPRQVGLIMPARAAGAFQNYLNHWLPDLLDDRKDDPDVQDLQEPR